VHKRPNCNSIFSYISGTNLNGPNIRADCVCTASANQDWNTCVEAHNLPITRIYIIGCRILCLTSAIPLATKIISFQHTVLLTVLYEWYTTQPTTGHRDWLKIHFEHHVVQGDPNTSGKHTGQIFTVKYYAKQQTIASPNLCMITIQKPIILNHPPSDPKNHWPKLRHPEAPLWERSIIYNHIQF
jgi:hypothetical protein